MKYLLVFIFLSACDHVEQGTEYPIDYKLVDSVVQQFEEEFQLTVTSKIVIEDAIFKNGSLYGGCNLQDNIVYLRESFWRTALTYGSREALLFHELGHCMLGLHHEPNTIMDSGLPMSIPAFVYDYENSVFKMKYEIPRYPGF